MVTKPAVSQVGTNTPAPFEMVSFKYPPGLLVTNGYDLLASSNLVDWFVYPTNKYVHGVDTITVTNDSPRMFFRVRVY